MRELTLGGLDDQGDQLILLDAQGERYFLPLNQALKSAVLNNPAPKPVVQGSKLRPNEIQRLLRNGASVESLVEETGMDHDYISRLARPIMNERNHIAQLARGFRLSRGTQESLNEVVTPRLAAREIEGSPSWDAWKLEDGSWSLHLNFTVAGRTRFASWSLDMPNKLAIAVDDEARWLSHQEELAETPAKSRLSAVTEVFNLEEPPARQLPSAEASPGPISDEELELLNSRRGRRPNFKVVKDQDFADDIPKNPFTALNESIAADLGADPELGTDTGTDPDTYPGTEPGTDEKDDYAKTEELESLESVSKEAEEANDLAKTFPTAPQQLNDENKPASPSEATLPGFEEISQAEPKPRKGRASIPSWDDIVFGAPKRK